MDEEAESKLIRLRSAGAIQNQAPGFEDETTGDYRLTRTSPMIDAGTLIYGINDFAVVGQAPDIGAIEFLLTNDLSGQEMDNNFIKLYPNPFINELIIGVEQGFTTGNIIVYDLLGRIVIVQDFSGQQASLKTNALSPGIYVIKIKVGRQWNTFRVVKSR